MTGNSSGGSRAAITTKLETSPVSDALPGGWAGADCCDLNEVVAFNFRRARHLRGWTQPETAARLEPLVGRLFTQAGISSIESAYRGQRRRLFDAHELAVFAELFNLPIVWFLLPPTGDDRRLVDTSRRVGDLYELIFGRGDQHDAADQRRHQLGIDRPALAGPDAESVVVDEDRECLAEMLLALVYHQAGPLERALEDMGAFFEPLRRVGLRRFLAGQVEPPDPAGTGRSTNHQHQPARRASASGHDTKGGTDNMSSGPNSVTVAGNVTRDPELRFLPSGQATATFCVAVNRRWQSQVSHEWEEETSYVDVVCWGDLAHNVAASASRGTRCVVTGRLGQRSWENAEGEKRSKVDITADDVALSLRFATGTLAKATRRSAAPDADSPAA